MKYTSQDFRMDLRKTLTPKNGIWVGSGYSVCAPKVGTVTGVEGCFSPPFAAPDSVLSFVFTANGHTVLDNGSKGKNDCGLLYAGGEWCPEKIVRNGTYHWNVEEKKLISFSVQSELIPLFGTHGFAVRISVRNRMPENLDISANAVLSAGHPSIVPLDDWEFMPPKPAKEEAVQQKETVWENGEVRISLVSEEKTKCLKPEESAIFQFAVILGKAGEEVKISSIDTLCTLAEDRWNRLIALANRNVPVLKSDIPGLAEYYKRSLLSGLISIWENDAFVTNPFPATSGIDGGSVCCYPWDVAGYSARTLVMLFGKRSLDFLKAMLASGIDRHISMSLGGGGLGWCAYSYSMWSLVNLYSVILADCQEGYELFDEIVRIFEAEEARLPEWEHLKDYGRQHNLLEMRSCGYEYYVVSPNAERAFCYDRLADIGTFLGCGDFSHWHEKAEKIRTSIVKNLWDEEQGWFKCVHSEQRVEMVYSIQMFDAIRNGACNEAMKNAMLRQLCDGAFLGKYGVSSVSAKDTLHYETNDPDWSGAGSYTGEGPNLAETLWQAGEAELAWDVLQRHFWMGEHLLYYPQEHYCDIPGVPENKRSNIISGVEGLHAVLFGMIGLKPSFDGALTVDPNPLQEGFVEITGYHFRDLTIDILLKPAFVKVVVNGKVFYEGQPQNITIAS